MQQTDYSQLGFPRYFIKIGIALIILPLLFMGVTKGMYGNVTEEFGARNVEIMKVFFNIFIIIGLAFLAFSRRKHQDESIIRIRMAGLFGSFIAGIIIVIISPLADIIFGTEIGKYESEHLIILMLALNIVFSNSTKQQVEKKIVTCP